MVFMQTIHRMIACAPSNRTPKYEVKKGLLDNFLTKYKWNSGNEFLPVFISFFTFSKNILYHLNIFSQKPTSLMVSWVFCFSQMGRLGFWTMKCGQFLRFVFLFRRVYDYFLGFFRKTLSLVFVRSCGRNRWERN